MLIWQIPIFSMTVLYIVIGISMYCLFHFFIYRSAAIYVMAHEFTHAAFAMIFGYRVKKIKVSAKGGYVEMSESNFIIDLAPYFFPLYTVILTASFFALHKIFDLTNYFWLFFIFFGITLAFHFLSNWDILKIEQPDLNVVGKTFGIIFVLISNIIVINLLLMVLFIDYINLNTIINNFYLAYQYLQNLF